MLHAVQSPHVLDFISHSAAQTIRIGQRLGELLRQGDLVVLLGDFGTGKTHLIKGVARGLGSADLVNSPSFVLINEYRAGEQHRSMPIFHVDLYRIEDSDELTNLAENPEQAVVVTDLSAKLREAVKTTFPADGKTPELRTETWAPNLTKP